MLISIKLHQSSLCFSPWESLGDKKQRIQTSQTYFIKGVYVTFDRRNDLIFLLQMESEIRSNYKALLLCSLQSGHLLLQP